MSDEATDGSSHGSDPASDQSDDEATPGYSNNENESLNNLGSQFSDPRHQYAQRAQADQPDRGDMYRPNRGDVYEHRDHIARYERPQQPARFGVSRINHQQQQRTNQDLQARENHRRHEEQQRAEHQRREQRRQYEERLAAQRSLDRARYPPKDPKDEDESRQSRRRKPR